MIDINELRRKLRSDNLLDHIDIHANVKPVLTELINRLEDAESDALEQARLNGMGSEREAALMARLEAAEKERDTLRAEVQTWQEQAKAYWSKIEQMERQEPVAFGLYSGWALKATYLKEHEACEQRDRRQLTADLGGSIEAYRVAPLYALPGAQAQPAPSVPADTFEIIRGLVREIERNTCTHEETHRGGFLWEICDSCGARWADDMGGKPEFKWPKVVEKARDMLEANPGAKGETK